MSDRSNHPLIPNAWYIAAWSNELTEAPLAREILNQHVVLFRDAQGKAAALEDRCCHRAAPLSCGRVVEEGLQCGYHGMTFDGTGKCTVNPGEKSLSLRVKSFPIVERQKFIWIWTGDRALADESKIVDWPWHDQEQDWPFRFGRYDMDCNFMLVMDNLMDITHLGYVHTKTIGGTPKHHVEAIQTETPTERGVRMTRWTLNSPPPPTYVKAVGFKGNIDRWANFEYVAPASVLQWSGALDVGRGAQDNQDQEGAFRIRLFHGATPKTQTTCHYFWSVANGYRQDDPQASEDLYNEIVPTFWEDKEIMELQQQALLREPNRPLVVREHDTALILAHQAFDRFAETAGLRGSGLAAE